MVGLTYKMFLISPQTDQLVRGKQLSLFFFKGNFCILPLGDSTGIGPIYTIVCSLSHVPTLCDPMDCNPPGSSVHGILQARILEWFAFSYSRRSS